MIPERGAPRWRRMTVIVSLWASVLGAGAATAQDLETLAREAEGDTLALIIHGVEGHEATVREFQRRFPKVNVQVTVQNPSMAGPRVVTEQQNGVYSWDSWWAGTAEMNHAVAQAGAFAPMTDYLVLPEVRDPSMWRAPDYLYASDEPYVFLHSVHVDTAILFNSDVVRDLEVREPRDLFDPRLKGRIAIRDPSSGTHNGAYTFAALLQQEGPEFLRRLLLEQEPVIIDNGRQITDGVLRGDYAVALGGHGDILARCHNWGGCRSVRQLSFGACISSRGVAVFKNAPHPAAARLWVNWFLSREGQEVYVREWAKDQANGAVSLRRDVEPHPEHAYSAPDYDRLYSYVSPGIESGKANLYAAQDLFVQTRREMKRSAPVSAQIVAWLTTFLGTIWLGYAAVRRFAKDPAARSPRGGAAL